MDKTSYIVLVGDIERGLTPVGPFGSFQAATEWRDRHIAPDAFGSILPLHLPTSDKALGAFSLHWKRREIS